MTTGRRSSIRGELREWREVHLRESSYFAGVIFGDRKREKRDGSPFITGFVITRLDRGTYWLVKTAGQHAYLLYKDRALHQTPTKEQRHATTANSADVNPNVYRSKRSPRNK